MDVEPGRRSALVIGGLLVAAVLFVALTLTGGQVSKILSTVGGSVGNFDAQGGGSSSSGDEGPDPTSASGSGGQVANAAAAVPTLLIVRTGDLRVEVADLEAALRDADAAVTRAGGYISGSSRASSGADAAATATYRIPSATWDSTLAALHGLAAKVTGEKITTDEVTGQVVDLTAHIANLRATEAALQSIMAKATKISDVLAVQEQLTTTRGEIEKLVADKEHLQDRAAYGSLTVTFDLPPTVHPSATPTPAKGWDPGDDVARATGKLVGIGQTSTSVGIWLAIVALPLLIAAAVIVTISWQLYRLARWILRRRDELAAPGA